MRLCTVRTGDLDPFFGILIKNKILRLSVAAARMGLRPAQRAYFDDLLVYLQGLPHSEKQLRKLLQAIADSPKQIVGNAEDGFPFLIPSGDVTYLPPVRRPGKFLCIGLNYRDHCEEQNRPIPEFPIVFNKFATSLIGHGAEIPLPLKADEQIDYEAEFAFVIGKTARRVKKRHAMAHVAGYMIVNDVSARALQARERQWSRAKGFDGAGPCGPFLVTPDEVENPGSLAVRLKLNGKVMQSSNTKHLVFGIEELIQHISAVITLEPGDVISTGTPGGVGLYREPQVFLKPGDMVEVEIEKLGTLRNSCIKA
ncbi:MAG: acylpyruvate hydrolase [Candidatus Sumerlaeota bacterium]|nr:acylpyruvate hydrolase [Candidatus Sumerlaeota bacterium]